ncbi:MAG TPA: hypothetical protein VFS62_10620 [Chloroflexota bacterium]|nr:hypothetical protein [Chloroflexota bacterium]
MKIVETLSDFPKKVALRGLQLEAYQALQNVDISKPVIKIAPDGQNVAAVKRAFAAAAKALNGSVETRNAEDGAILVKWSPTPSTRGRRGSGGAVKPHKEHSEADVDKEARRLFAIKPSGASFEGLPDGAKRKLRISAKRNLSRRG